ncbi:sulfurtransferase complex subunit TusD [Psychrobacter sp. UBA3962]|uniref:sulfurtransferase complex subunit TusD n=1 Tax=Psychrobacter sp. UBA3962 TaxID=1947352 RepID=UPI0025F3D970|nr:sulfurtransferase complex subunit TusD [Psychrobacter sp. UBA3962]
MTTANTLLLIHVDPSQSIAWHAYRYAKAFLENCSSSDESSRSKLNIFFYGEAANTGNALRWQTADRANLTQLWSQLSQEHQLRLPVCVSTALTRGITDEDNAKRHKLEGNNLATGFELVGLGELAEQLSLAQKVVTF